MILQSELGEYRYKKEYRGHAVLDCPPLCGVMARGQLPTWQGWASFTNFGEMQCLSVCLFATILWKDA